MTMNEYAKSRGLTVQLIAQKLGMSRQAISRYGADEYHPTVTTLEKLARAMTELGASTTVVDLVAALYEKKEQED